MTLVVDASVAAKWILPEDGSDRAAALRGESEEMVAPSLIVAEIGNAVWKRAMWGEMSMADALHAQKAAVRPFSRLVPLPELADRATELAIELRHPIYDCFYLALAERERCPVVSADGKMLAAAKRAKGIKARPL